MQTPIVATQFKTNKKIILCSLSGICIFAIFILKKHKRYTNPLLIQMFSYSVCFKLCSGYIISLLILFVKPHK